MRIGASAERRLGGRVVRSLAIWLTPLARLTGLDGDAALAAQLVARGVVEGSYDPKSIYRTAPPAAGDTSRCTGTGATSRPRRGSTSSSSSRPARTRRR